MLQFDFLESINNKIQDTISKKVNTVFPAVVLDTSDYTTQQTLDVKPLIMKKRKDGSVLDSAAIYTCPVVLPSGGGGYLSFPFVVGDIVLVGISQSEISQWMFTMGEAIAATEYDNFNLNEAIILGGMGTTSNNNNPSSDLMELVFGNSSINISKTDDIKIINENGEISLDQDGAARLSNSNGDLTLQGSGRIDITNNGEDININSLGGDLDLRTAGGNVDVLSTGGDVNVSSSDGDVNVSSSGGDVVISTDKALFSLKDDGTVSMSNDTSDPANTGSITIDSIGVITIVGREVNIEATLVGPASGVRVENIRRLKIAPDSLSPNVDLVTHIHSGGGTSPPV